MIRTSWNHLPDVIKKYIIDMNPSWKDIHKEIFRDSQSEIRSRRRDLICIQCNRKTIFETGVILRRPSTRIYAIRETTHHSGPYRVRVFCECAEHRTSNTFEYKLLLPKKCINTGDIYEYCTRLYGNISSIIMYKGCDERDMQIRNLIMNGNHVVTFERKRPTWEQIYDNK